MLVLMWFDVSKVAPQNVCYTVTNERRILPTSLFLERGHYVVAIQDTCFLQFLLQYYQVDDCQSVSVHQRKQVVNGKHRLCLAALKAISMNSRSRSLLFV